MFSQSEIKLIKNNLLAIGVSDWLFYPFNENYAVTKRGDIYSVCKQQKSKNGYSWIKLFKTAKLQGSTDKYGYKTIKMLINGKKRHLKVHRVVAETFIQNEYQKPAVNHINGVKTDNSVENLEWVTNAENNNHAIKTGLNKQKRYGHHKLAKIKAYDYIPIYFLINDLKQRRSELADRYGVSRQTIDNVFNATKKAIDFYERKITDHLLARK